MLLKTKMKLGRVSTLALPFILSVLFLVNNTLIYFDIDSYLCYLCGVNPFLLIYFYINSSIYNLCSHHRMFIHYLLITYLTCTYDSIIGISISDRNLLLSNYIIFGIAVVLYGILKFKDNRNKL